MDDAAKTLRDMDANDVLPLLLAHKTPVYDIIEWKTSDRQIPGTNPPRYFSEPIRATEPTYYEVDGLSDWFYEINDTQTVEGLGTVYKVKEHGGEGQGDEAWFVLKVSSLDGEVERYFRQEGYYASYDGFDWDGPFREVKPVDRVVTFYEEI